MHWNCLDPSYLILHGEYVQRVAADRSVARQAFGLRDVGRSGAMIQDGFQKTKKNKTSVKVFGVNRYEYIFFSTNSSKGYWWHHLCTVSAPPEKSIYWNSRISGATLLKCASLQVLFWHCLGGCCNETDIYSSYKIHENMIHTSGWRILMHFKKSSCHVCFAESLSYLLRPRLSCRLATCHNEHWENEGKNPTARWSKSPSSGMFQSSGGRTVRLFLIWISMLACAALFMASKCHKLQLHWWLVNLLPTSWGFCCAELLQCQSFRLCNLHCCMFRLWLSQSVETYPKYNGIKMIFAARLVVRDLWTMRKTPGRTARSWVWNSQCFLQWRSLRLCIAILWRWALFPYPLLECDGLPPFFGYNQYSNINKQTHFWRNPLIARNSH